MKQTDKKLKHCGKRNTGCQTLNSFNETKKYFKVNIQYSNAATDCCYKLHNVVWQEKDIAGAFQVVFSMLREKTGRELTGNSKLWKKWQVILCFGFVLKKMPTL